MKKTRTWPLCKREHFLTNLGTILLTSLPSQPDSRQEERDLHTVDVVTHLGNRSVVSIGIDKEWGIVQYREIFTSNVSEDCTLMDQKVPSIIEIHPYTKHERFCADEIRLFEACNIEELDGAETWRHKARKPSYRFGYEVDAIAFQCALRGKALLHTFQVEEITSGRGSEGTAQPLKLWSDLDGRNKSISFLVQQSKPYYHIDIPLRLFGNSIHTSDSGRKVRVELVSRKTKKGRNSMNKTGLLRRFSDLLRHSPPDKEQGYTGRDPGQEIADTIVEDDLPTQDTQFLLSLGYLRFEFTGSNGKSIIPCNNTQAETLYSNSNLLIDASMFQEELETFFLENRETKPSPGQHVSISRENSEGAGPPSPIVVPEHITGPEIRQRRESLGNQFNIPESGDPLRPGPLCRPSIGITNPGFTRPPMSPETAPLSQVTKDLDYRVRGIKLEHAVPDLLTYLSRKLGIEPTVVGRVKALATSQTGDKVAVVAWRPQPACLSTPGKDEWEFGPTSNEDEIYITVDTHFRGVTVLYSPPPDVLHMIE